MSDFKIPFDTGFSRQPSRRPMRVADAIQRELSMLFLTGIKDPRLVGLTITKVTVSKDLRQAKIYYSIEQERKSEVEDGLQRASGYLRSHLAKELGLRYVPVLRFTRDFSLDAMEKIDHLLHDQD